MKKVKIDFVDHRNYSELKGCTRAILDLPTLYDEGLKKYVYESKNGKMYQFILSEAAVDFIDYEGVNHIWITLDDTVNPAEIDEIVADMVGAPLDSYLEISSKDLSINDFLKVHEVTSLESTNTPNEDTGGGIVEISNPGGIHNPFNEGRITNAEINTGESESVELDNPEYTESKTTFTYEDGVDIPDNSDGIVYTDDDRMYTTKVRSIQP